MRFFMCFPQSPRGRWAAIACLASAVGLLAITGCRTVPPPPPEAGAYDYKSALQTVVESMLQHGLKKDDGSVPVITSGPIRTNTTKYVVNTEMIYQDIRIEIMKSRLARFSAATDEQRKGGESGNLYKQLEFQAKSGLVDPATAAAYGKVVGADYILYGDVYRVREQNYRGETQELFKLVLTLTEVQTGLAVWSDSALAWRNFPVLGTR